MTRTHVSRSVEHVLVRENVLLLETSTQLASVTSASREKSVKYRAMILVKDSSHMVAVRIMMERWPSVAIPMEDATTLILERNIQLMAFAPSELTILIPTRKNVTALQQMTVNFRFRAPKMERVRTLHFEMMGVHVTLCLGVSALPVSV